MTPPPPESPDGTAVQLGLHGGCHAGMPVRKDDEPGSGCRRDCLHRAMVLEYRDWRHSWEQRRERAEHMQLEDDEYAAMFPAPTFRDWLRGIAGRNERKRA